MSNSKPACVYCQRTSDEIPLVVLEYQGETWWICPQHFPILIHQPAKLAGKLPGVERLSPSEGHEH